MVMYSKFTLLITFFLAVNYGISANNDEFGELLVKQLIGRIKEPYVRGTCPLIVTEVISYTRNEAEPSDNLMSYDVIVKLCRKNCVLLSFLEKEQVEGRKNHCQTCERTVTVKKEPFKILDEVDNGCDDDTSDNNELELRNSFEKFVNEYNKQYDNEEVKENRFRIFRENLVEAERLQQSEKGTATYGINEFSDLTDEEFSSRGGLLPIPDYDDQPNESAYDNAPLPAKFDWRSKGVVSRVKNQGQCESCWAFATTGVLEAQYAREHKQLVEFSEQELVDCDERDNGCSKGIMMDAFEAIKTDLKGLVKASDYPYVGRQKTCTVDKTKHVVTIKEYGRIKPLNTTAMATFLVNEGPIAAAVNMKLLKSYTGGIIHNTCESTIDHAVLIVGYGIAKIDGRAVPYWIVKNSWDKTWGENGYFRIVRGFNHCGIESYTCIAYVN